MSAEHCELHDCDATNGCPQCIADRQATCVHGGLSCSDCGLSFDALRTSLRQQFEAAGFHVQERVRIVAPVGTREQLLARLELYPSDQLLFIGGEWAAPRVLTRAELVSWITEIESSEWDRVYVRAISSSQLWPM